MMITNGLRPIACETAHEVVSRLRPLMPGGSWAIETIDHFGHEPGYRVRWPVPDDATVDAIDRAAVVSFSESTA